MWHSCDSTCFRCLTPPYRASAHSALSSALSFTHCSHDSLHPDLNERVFVICAQLHHTTQPLLSATRCGPLRFVGTWAGTFLLQTYTIRPAVVAPAPTPDSVQLTCWSFDVLHVASAAPQCTWACRRDLPSTGPGFGSSGMLIAGRPCRGCIFLPAADLGRLSVGTGTWLVQAP